MDGRIGSSSGRRKHSREMAGRRVAAGRYRGKVRQVKDHARDLGCVGLRFRRLCERYDDATQRHALSTQYNLPART